MSTEDMINTIANMTKGLTNRTEVCVINNMETYNFSVNAPNQSKIVEKPRLPSLVIGEGGIIQNGLIEQEKSVGGTSQNFGKNQYELIPHDRYKQVKELMGYMGLKTAEYDLLKVVQKDIEVGVSYINCGSNADLIVDGTTYSKDVGLGGNICDVSYPIVGGGKWEQLYQSARSTGASQTGVLSWDIPIDTNTSHKMVLRFADYWPINRASDITINGLKRKEDFNIVGIAGGSYKRLDLTFRVPVNNNKIELSINNGGQLNAIEIYKLNKGDVEFVVADRDNKTTNKDVFLFVNKNINISEQNLKKKFLEIQGSILKSRNLYFF